MADAKPGAMSETSTTVAVTNATDPKNIQDLTVFVQTLLQQMQERFQGMSDQIIARIDDMGTRIDDLEKNISELMTQAGMDEPEKWRDEGMIWTRLFDDILPAELDFRSFPAFLRRPRQNDSHHLYEYPLFVFPLSFFHPSFILPIRGCSYVFSFYSCMMKDKITSEHCLTNIRFPFFWMVKEFISFHS